MFVDASVTLIVRVQVLEKEMQVRGTTTGSCNKQQKN